MLGLKEGKTKIDTSKFVDTGIGDWKVNPEYKNDKSVLDIMNKLDNNRHNGGHPDSIHYEEMKNMN